MAIIMQVVILAFACQTILASAAQKVSGKSTEGERTIFIDGGTTSSPGDIVDIFLYFGTFTLAVVTALAIIGLIYGITENTSSGSGTGGYGATGFESDFDSYSAYDKIYNVARSLYSGYQKYEEARDLTE